MSEKLLTMYAKAVTVSAIVMWAGFVAQLTLAAPVSLLPHSVGVVLRTVLNVAIVVVPAWFFWPRLGHLQASSLGRSPSIRRAIVLLSLALIAFPGAVLIPVVADLVLGTSNAPVLMWAAVIGLPAFAVLSLIGLWGVFSSRPGSSGSGA
jgi:hypothetical protein